MREENKETIKKIENHFRKKGFKCKREYPTIFNSVNPKKAQVNKIDICCWQTYPKKIIRCVEVEDSQRQAVKNFRAGVQHSAEMRKQKFDSKFFQVIAGENFKEVCK